MALVVSQQPQLYTPAFNDQFITALSNQIAVADFKYIVTVEVNGSGIIKTDNILQRPDGYLVYDPQEWVKNYITRNYFDPNISSSIYINQAIGKGATVQVKVKEYYSGTVQSTTTINYNVWDACLTKRDFELYNYTNYIVNGSNIIPFDSNAIIDNRISLLNGNRFIHFFKLTGRKIKCELFNASNVSQGTFTLNFNIGLIIYADLGYNTCVSNGLTPLDGYYLVYKIQDISNVTLFQDSFTFKDICTYHNPYVLYYLTRTGKIESFNFELLSQESVSKKNTTVRLSPNKMRSGGIYGSYQYDRELFTTSTQETKVITLNTNWITESQSIALQDLWDSPIIFIKDLTLNQIYSVSIKATSYTKSKHINQPLFNYSVECEYSIQENRQRGI